MPKSAIISVTADGCGVNTGVKKGVIRLLKQEFGDHLIFTWCYLHRLNLAVMRALSMHANDTDDGAYIGSCRAMKNAVSSIDELIRWIHFSGKRTTDLKLVGTQLGARL